MAKQKNTKGPQFVRFFSPLIESLRDLGGSGRPSEVKDRIAEKLRIPESVQNETIGSGESRFSNQVAWARFYLAKAGYLDSSTRGVWSLTDKGRDSSLNDGQAQAIFKDVHLAFKGTGEDQLPSSQNDIKGVATGGENTVNLDTVELDAVEEKDHRIALMKLLLSLPPVGFEQLCQRLLRESGFERVTVTGKSGDGGIDGNGILQLNPFVSFKVLFQCKRYTGSVGSGVVRDFRGAMMGRADKGIIMTTGSFTAEANKEAIRDGVPPIELVDGEKLLDMFEYLEMGLKPKKAYELDYQFFEEFKRDISK